MLTENQKLWVEALRSGEYKQGFGQLQIQDRYCCLGVLCRVYEKVVGKPVNKNGNLPHSCLSPPYEAVRNWAGLDNSYGKFAVTNFGEIHGDIFPISSLTELNDNLKFSFSQIADFIESEPEGLFVNAK
jgi:hypothetical protein